MQNKSRALGEMPLYNTRADEMWEFMVKNVDFVEKSVLDAGCGYADLMWRAYKAGAKIVFGFDIDKHVVYWAGDRLDSYGFSNAPIYVLRGDINRWSEKWPGKHDVVICTSVLPYLEEPAYIIECMLRDSETAIIECQYSGDGPGFERIKDDKDMAQWIMECGANNVEIIGKTQIRDRSAERTIWKCT